MKQPLTIVLVLFCTAFFYAQNSDSLKLVSFLGGLDSHIQIHQDSNVIAKNWFDSISHLPNTFRNAFTENGSNIHISLTYQHPKFLV